MDHPAQTEAPSRPTPAPAAKAGSRIGTRIVGAVVAAAGIGALGYFVAHRGGESKAESREAGAKDAARGDSQVARVEVTRPRKGGIARVVDQVASVHAYEFADIYAQVSGYLKSQVVDYGDVVKKGAVIARIDIPKEEKRLEQAEAVLAQSRARVEQARAMIETARARLEASKAKVQEAAAEVGSAAADRVYRKTALDRIIGLAESNSVEHKLVDESRQQLQAAQAAEEAKKAAVITARADVLGAAAEVKQAEADLVEAQSRVGISQADLDAARVVVDFAAIQAPYDGVVTRRNFFPGAFIRAAEEGGTLPMFSVARQDKVRIATQVDDRFVPYLRKGDDAVVRLDSLPGREFLGKVSRFADAEDPASRLMYTEIDMENPDDLLRDGMYGRVLITVAPSKAGMSIPSSCLIEKKEQQWVVYVVRDGKARKTLVDVGNDNGVEAEILGGLSLDMEVVAAVNGAIADGVPVESAPYVGRKDDAAKPAAPPAH